jgi:hypothetical protein
MREYCLVLAFISCTMRLTRGNWRGSPEILPSGSRPEPAEHVNAIFMALEREKLMLFIKIYSDTISLQLITCLSNKASMSLCSHTKRDGNIETNRARYFPGPNVGRVYIAAVQCRHLALIFDVMDVISYY